MKRAVLLAIMVVACGSASVYAFKFPAYNGDVPFDHRLHRLKFDCKACHDGPPQHMELDHESGHKLCLGCHKRVGEGPARHCSDCHKLV